MQSVDTKLIAKNETTKNIRENNWTSIIFITQ